MFPVAVVFFICSCVCPANVKSGSGPQCLGRHKAHPVSAVIKHHRCILAMKIVAESRKNKRRLRTKSLILPFVMLFCG